MEEEKKIGFFKRVKISIFNLEDYKIFIKEKFSKALKYLLLLIVIGTIVLAIVSTINLKKEITKALSYFKEDFPDFSYSDGKLNVAEKVKAYDEEYDAKLIVDTSDNISEDLYNQYKKEVKDGYYSVVLLKDKVFYVVGGLEYETSYTNFATTFGLSNFTKQELFENHLNDSQMPKITTIIWIYAFITLFVANFLTVIEDTIIVAVFGWLTAKICKISLKFASAASLAIYSLTLSIILSTIYTVIYSFTNFEIKYFSLMYMIIAYIYMIASVMMLKVDINKGAGELIPIKEEPKKKEKEELLEDVEDKKEKDEKEKKDDKISKDKEEKEETNIDTEPKGSEI